MNWRVCTLAGNTGSNEQVAPHVTPAVCHTDEWCKRARGNYACLLKVFCETTTGEGTGLCIRMHDQNPLEGGRGGVSPQMSHTFMCSLRHRDYLCVAINTERSRRARSMAFTVPGMVRGDCLLICKWRAGCQVRNISGGGCWVPTRFFIYSEHEITPLKLFAALESFWFCNLPAPLWGLQKTIVPKLHVPTSLPRWQTCRALLAAAFITSWNRAAESSLQQRLSKSLRVH